MPWKLILFIFLIVIIAVFMGANLDNKTPISLIFYSTNPVPVYLIILYSFCAGVIVMLPFTFGKRSKADKKNADQKKFGKKADKNNKNEIKPDSAADIDIYEDQT